MKKSKKSKALLSSTVGLLAATSVVAPLATMTSCANENTQLENATDKEYGIAEQTYIDLRNQFKTEYQTKLILEHGDGWEDLPKHIGYLENQLKSLDKIKDEKKNGFTSLTSAMVEFAKTGRDLDGNVYNIRLNRKSNAQWSQLDTIFANWKESFSTYMLNSDMTQSAINRVMKDAENKFSNLKTELMQKCNDALDGVIQGKELLITCFEEVNDEIALVSASLQLKQMMNQYVFDTKTDAPACLDNLTTEGNKYYAEDFKVGRLLSEKTMNQLFTIKRKETPDAEIKYSPSLIKGYTIQPKLTKITTNIYTNTNTFSIDFGLVKTSYIGKYDKAQLAGVTAHLYSGDNWDDFDKIDDSTTLAQVMVNQHIESNEYPIYLTKEAEHKALEDAYFNKDSVDGYISFQWDNKNANNQAYESFFDNATKADTSNTHWTAKLSQNSLMNSGLMITSNSNDNETYKFIKDILKSKNNVNTENYLEKTPDNLAELFLLNCDFSANVKIDETNAKNRVVDIASFFANYNNSIYAEENEGKYKLQNTIDYVAYQTKCINHAVSNAFFEKINTKFNDAVRFVKSYDGTIVNYNNAKNAPITESGLEKLRDDADSELLNATISIILGTIATGFTIFELWKPWNQANADTKIVNIVTLVFLIVSLVIQIGLYTFWMVCYYKPMDDYLNRYRNFKDYSPTSQFVDTLKGALNDHFVLLNEDGSYDKKEFETKKKAFSAHNMEWMLNQYRTYSNKNNIKGWTEYNTRLKTDRVDPEEIWTTIKGWKAGGKYWMIQIAVTIVMVLISVVMNYVLSAYYEVRQIERQVEIDQITEMEERKRIAEAQRKACDNPQTRLDKFYQSMKEEYEAIADELANACPWGLPGTLMLTALVILLSRYGSKIWDDFNGNSHFATKDKNGEKISVRQQLHEYLTTKTSKGDEGIDFCMDTMEDALMRYKHKWGGRSI